MMRYELVNGFPTADELDPDKEYTTKIRSVYYDDGEMVIRLEYIGEAFPKGSHSCLLPITKL